MKLESLTEGQIVYDVGRTKMGNTTMYTVSVWHVRIIRIDAQTRRVYASWNTNPEREYRERTWKKWRLTKPVLVKSGMGHRLATRAEIKAMKATDPGASA